MKALSVGFGIFMGIVPIWGFQLAVAIPLAFVFRLNKPLVILAANISMPPMIPLILFLSHVTGALWMGEHAVSISFDRELTLDWIKESSLQYMLGAITLSIIAGLFSGCITYCLVKFYRRRPST